MRGQNGSAYSDDTDSDDPAPDIQGAYHVRRAYEYNDLNELTSCMEYTVSEDNTEIPIHETSYEFDRIGNRTAETVDGIKTEYTYDEDGLNLLVSESRASDDSESESAVTYSYDSAGNLTEVHDREEGRVTEYEYNSSGMMSKATITDGTGDDATTTVTENVYNGEGTRIAKKEGTKTVHYVSVSGTLLCTFETTEGSSGITVTSENVAGTDGKIFLTKRPDGNWYVYSNDLRGSVTAIADEANSYVETCFYDIYGEPEIWKSLDGGIYNE